MRWLSSREGVPDPFLDLEAPRKPRHEGEWLTPAEFQRMLEAAGKPLRRHTGIVERDRLVLLALVTTGLRRSELINLEWRDLALDDLQPSLLVRHGKGDKPRRQPLAPQLADELRLLQRRIAPPNTDPVFCGLAGRRLQPKVLAAIIKRAAERAGLDKRVTAHTLRHTAATWLRQETGDTRLVAEYLGHADLSTVSRYAHVAERELHEATAALGRLASTNAAEKYERRAA
jgi:integrase/recombinase XerD